MRSARSWLLSLVNSSNRASARALQQGNTGQEDARRQDLDQGKQSGQRRAAARAPSHYDREASWRQTQLAEPWRSSPSSGNRQDAAGNRRRMPGSSPEPYRRRHFSAQARRPHRTARREALRHAIDKDGAIRRGLTAVEPVCGGICPRSSGEDQPDCEAWNRAARSSSARSAKAGAINETPKGSRSLRNPAGIATAVKS